MKYIERMKEKFDALGKKRRVRILAIESSCDETAVSIVENGRAILSNIISSQIEIHKRFGGVVPEVASRNHIVAITNVLNEALEKANLTLKEIDAVAVTYGAGLIGALLVGINFAKALAFGLDVPLIAVSHIDGHIAANYLTHSKLKPPFLCLMVSGGHTAIFDIDDYTSKKLLGTTQDDAAGEAFDKVARVLGLPYPGGPNIEKLAKDGENNIEFIKKEVLKGSLDFSFSGIKTAVVNYLHTHEQRGEEVNKADVACSFQHYVTDELVKKAKLAAKTANRKKIVVAGGVGANKLLQEKFGEKTFFPKLGLCTDNAAMIASAAYYYVKAGKGLADLNLTASPTVRLI